MGLVGLRVHFADHRLWVGCLEVVGGKPPTPRGRWIDLHLWYHQPLLALNPNAPSWGGNIIDRHPAYCFSGDDGTAHDPYDWIRCSSIRKDVPTLFDRYACDPSRVWYVDRIGWPQDCRKSSDAVGRGLGANQHRCFSTVGCGTGNQCMVARKEVARH